MKRTVLVLAGLVAVLLVTSVAVVSADPDADLAAVRAATAAFHDPEVAQAAGWDLVPGLDYCFENPGVGGMGYHYINTALLDTQLDPEHPEAMVYAPGPAGRLKLGAVEYIVPVAAWSAAGNAEPPMLFGQHFHLNQTLGVYALHAWIWRRNPAGVFADWNPKVSCP